MGHLVHKTNFVPTEVLLAVLQDNKKQFGISGFGTGGSGIVRDVPKMKKGLYTYSEENFCWDKAGFMY